MEATQESSTRVRIYISRADSDVPVPPCNSPVSDSSDECGGALTF